MVPELGRAMPPSASSVPEPLRVLPPLQVKEPLTVRFPETVNVEAKVNPLLIVDAPEGSSLVEAPTIDKAPPEMSIAAWLLMLLTESEEDEECAMEMPENELSMTTSSETVGTASALQLAAVSQLLSPPLPVHEMSESSTRFSNKSQCGWNVLLARRTLRRRGSSEREKPVPAQRKCCRVRDCIVRFSMEDGPPQIERSSSLRAERVRALNRKIEMVET